MAALERQCTLLVHQDDAKAAEPNEVTEKLQHGSVEDKMMALKKIILLHLNGQSIPGMLMKVIQFVLPHEDTHLRKMGLYYLETVDKHDASGKLLPEMILVCNMIRNELVHPNEYTRGCALRFCCKLHDAEILEPLIPSVRHNLEHRHSFVRRNAVLAVHSVFEHFDFLIPDAPELVEQFLENENDIACKRNAFLMLCQCDQERAVNYLHENIQQVAMWGDTMQLSSLELVRRVCRSNPLEKGKYIKVIFALLGSSSAAVVYEAANTLISLSSAPTAIRAAAQCYCGLLSTQSDNNVKLILLDRLMDLRKNHLPVMQDLLMDMMRALSSPNMDLKRKTLALALDLVTTRNVEEVVSVLKKEVLRTQSGEMTETSQMIEYRRILIESVHHTAIRFPNVAPTAVNVLTDFIGDVYGTSAADVVSFVREISESFPDLRDTVLSKLLIALPGLRTPVVVRGALWILGEYSTTPNSIKDAFKTIMEGVGRLPLALPTLDGEEGVTENTPDELTPKAVKKPQILADGTYASQAAIEDPVVPVAAAEKTGPPLRALLLGGDYFVGVSVCTALTKLVLRLAETPDLPAELVNKVKGEAMLVCASLIRFGRSESAPSKIDDGTAERIIACIQTLNGAVSSDVWLSASRKAFAGMITAKREKEAKDAAEKAKKDRVKPEELIDFGILRARRLASGSGEETVDEMDLARGAGETSMKKTFDLARVVQLTGMSDPVYAEAHLTVHQYDIILDVTVINKTSDTLNNLVLELATMGDLRLCERPQSYTFGPQEQKSIRANIKVSSTETGIIFGNIVYDTAGSMSNGCIILNDIHIDVMDYIKPGEVTDAAFRSMWAEFEWENKVAVNTSITDLSEFLDYIIESTNMRCLTLRGIERESGFLAANLYATSIFSEDALVNVSAEKTTDGSLQGYIRIRSKTQGIALSLGDKITLRQTQKQAK